MDDRVVEWDTEVEIEKRFRRELFTDGAKKVWDALLWVMSFAIVRLISVGTFPTLTSIPNLNPLNSGRGTRVCAHHYCASPCTEIQGAPLCV